MRMLSLSSEVLTGLSMRASSTSAFVPLLKSFCTVVFIQHLWDCRQVSCNVYKAQCLALVRSVTSVSAAPFTRTSFCFSARCSHCFCFLAGWWVAMSAPPVFIALQGQAAAALLLLAVCPVQEGLVLLLNVMLSLLLLDCRLVGCNV